LNYLESSAVNLLHNLFEGAHYYSDTGKEHVIYLRHGINKGMK